MSFRESPKLTFECPADGRALLMNIRRSVVLHHHNFKKPVNAIQFSPNGKYALKSTNAIVRGTDTIPLFRYIAVTHDSHVQVWKTPNHLVREFAPFVLHRTYTGHHDEVLSLEWSPDST